jgi:hypothetical protein
MQSVWILTWYPDWEDEEQWVFASEADAQAALTQLAARYPNPQTSGHRRDRHPCGAVWEEFVRTGGLSSTEIEAIAGRHAKERV